MNLKIICRFYMSNKTYEGHDTAHIPITYDGFAFHFCFCDDCKKVIQTYATHLMISTGRSIGDK
jgi:hypothetical protein